MGQIEKWKRVIELNCSIHIFLQVVFIVISFDVSFFNEFHDAISDDFWCFNSILDDWVIFGIDFGGQVLKDFVDHLLMFVAYLPFNYTNNCSLIIMYLLRNNMETIFKSFYLDSAPQMFSVDAHTSFYRYYCLFTFTVW